MSGEVELSSLSSLTKRHSRSPPILPHDPASSMSSSSTPSDSLSVEGSSEYRNGQSLNDLNGYSPNWVKHSKRERLLDFFKAAWRGPDIVSDTPPRPLTSLQFVEDIPGKFRRKTSYWSRTLLLAIYLAVWITLWSKLLLPYLVEIPEVEGENTLVISLTCGQADQFWRGKNAACGLDAERCPSVGLAGDVIFRCPALCDRSSWLYSLRAVGDQVINYRGYFIGGGEKKDEKGVLSYPYRADSYPCGAAVHSGVISPFFGGCARVSYSSGARASFPDTKGHYGVSDSVGFSSFFPYLYFFKSVASDVTFCYDPRLLVLLLNVIMGIPVVFLGSGAAFYWIMALVGFWTITLATDPPVLVEPQDPESFYQLISLSLERFLPTCFVLFFLWKVSVKRTFETLPEYNRLPDEPEEVPGEQFTYEMPHSSCSTILRLVLWYPLFWLGILNNMTLDRLPVDRLTIHDLQQQPGAFMTVMIVGSILVFCIISQAYYVWLLGRFWKLLLVYGMIFASLIVLANIPGLSLRIHHYIFALIFIPGCSTRGKTAYAFQGILLGLFLSGVARWGFASIAETNLSLLRDEPTGQIYAPTFSLVQNGALYWKELESEKLNATSMSNLESYTDVSLLVNDVERYRGPDNGNLNLTQLIESDSELKELLELSVKSESKDFDEEILLYLRIAKYDPDRGHYGDYNRASILRYPSFNFTLGPPGIT